MISVQITEIMGVPMPPKPRVRLHAASRQYYVFLKGTQYYLGHDRVKAEAEGARLIAEHYANIAHDASQPLVAVPTDPMTIGELVSTYQDEHVLLRYKAKASGKASQVSVIKAAMAPLLKHYLTTPVMDFRASDLMQLQQILVAKKEHSRGTINRYTSLIKQMFSWALIRFEAELPNLNIQRLLAVPGLKKGQTKALDPELVKPVPEMDLKRTIPYLPKTVAQMVRLQALTGMRPMEVYLMRPCDIEMEGSIWRYTPHEHKLEHQEDAYRVIPLGRRAQKILRRFLERSPQEYCFSPREAEEQRLQVRHLKRKTPATSGNRPGTNRKVRRVKSPGLRYDRHSYRRAIHRACITAGVTPWSPNQLRHSFATRVRKQYSVLESQVMLGHKNLRTTEIYAKQNWDEACKIAEDCG